MRKFNVPESYRNYLQRAEFKIKMISLNISHCTVNMYQAYIKKQTFIGILINCTTICNITTTVVITVYFVQVYPICSELTCMFKITLHVQGYPTWISLMLVVKGYINPLESNAINLLFNIFKLNKYIFFIKRFSIYVIYF